MTELWLIRHGQAAFGTDHYDRLTKIGYAQARIVGEHLDKAGVHFDGVYSGSLERQIETGITALGKAPACSRQSRPLSLDAFDEYDFMAIIDAYLPGLLTDEPNLERKAEKMLFEDDAFVDIFGRIFLRWTSGQHDVPGVETFHGYQGRIMAGIQSILDENAGPDGCVAVFTSGGVIGTLVKIVLDLSMQIAMETGWQIRNASITRLISRHDRLTLSCFNTTCHLEDAGDPALLTYR